MNLNINQVTFPADAEVIIHEVSWEDYEHLMDGLGERGSLRVNYYNHRISLMAPSAGHEFFKVYMGDFVKYLFEASDRDFVSLGPATLHQTQVEKAVEADECFYVAHADKIRSKNKISLDIDPPPDLVIEIDIHSYANRELYVALGIPELWIYDGESLKILVLQAGEYQTVDFSPHFPSLALRDRLPEKRSVVMRAFRNWVDQHYEPVAVRTAIQDRTQPRTQPNQFGKLIMSPASNQNYYHEHHPRYFL